MMISALITEDHALAALYQRNGGCVVGIDQREDPTQVDFPEAEAVLTEWEALSEAFVRMIACHFHHKPYRVAGTERTLIRESIVEDYPAIRRMLFDCDKSAFSDGLSADEIGERQRFERYSATAYLFFGYGLWSVVRRSDGEVIGWCGLFPSRTEGRRGYAIELGYLIRRDLRRKGYGREVCTAILSYAQQEMGVDRICLHVPERNLASRRLAESLGFAEEPERCPGGFSGKEDGAVKRVGRAEDSASKRKDQTDEKGKDTGKILRYERDLRGER